MPNIADRAGMTEQFERKKPQFFVDLVAKANRALRVLPMMTAPPIRCQAMRHIAYLISASTSRLIGWIVLKNSTGNMTLNNDLQQAGDALVTFPISQTSSVPPGMPSPSRQ